MKMQYKKILVACTAFALAGSVSAALIDFESNTAGDIVGQFNSGEQWFGQFGTTTNWDVVSYDGGQALQIQSAGDGSGVRWIPNNASELGFTFDNSSSIVEFSFDMARPSDPGSGLSPVIRLTDISSSNEILSYNFWGFGDGLDTRINTGASGGAGFSIESSGISMPTGSTGYITISTIIDFANNEVTSLKYGGVEQLASAQSLGGIADTASTLGLYMNVPDVAGAALYIDNISIIPEPSTFALVGIALGAALFFRRRK